MLKKDKKKKAVSTPPPPQAQTQKPKPLNPYLKKEVNSGKQIQRKQPPPPPEPEPKKKSKKNEKPSKSKKTTEKATPVSRVPQLGLQNRAELPDGFLRDEYGQVFDPRFGKPPPPRSGLARRDSNVFDYSDYSDDDEYDDEGENKSSIYLQNLY